MSTEFNEWEAKSIESELDKIRAKYLMSPSDFEKSSTFKHINVRNTGTFKQDRDSIDTRNQSIDNYGNEVREFVIDHPFKNQLGSRSCLKHTDSYSKDPKIDSIDDDKENAAIQEIIVDKWLKEPKNYKINPKHDFKLAHNTNNINSKNKLPVSEVISSRFGKIENSSRTNIHDIPSTNDARINSKINIELSNKFQDHQKVATSVKYV